MIRQKYIRAILVLMMVTGSVLLLSSCGGGGGGMTTTSGMISGTAVKGPVNGASVTAYAISNGSMGAQIGSGTTDAQGNFTISLGAYAGAVMLQMTGGAYTDEATNTVMAMHGGDVMTSVIPSVTARTTMTGIQITPLTSLAQARAHTMTGGMTEANITAANTAVGAYFMVSDILHVTPINPLVPGSGTAVGVTSDMKNYGMAVAAMSQYASTLGMPFSSGIITAMMNDASDGRMDGMMGTTPISLNGMGGMMGGGMMPSSAGTSALAAAMTDFVNASLNVSGLTVTEMQTLITQLNTSTGQLPGAGGASVIGMVSGKAFLGAFSGGIARAFAVDNGIIGAQLTSGSTDTQGNFSLPVGAYTGPVMLQISGGTFTDLATGATMSMFSGDLMTSAIPSVTSGVTMTGIQITPLTSMAQARAQSMAGGMTAANIAAANTGVGQYFDVNDILLTQPMDPAVNGSGAAASSGARNYGMAVAAISQEASTLGMPHSSGMVTAMMKDASDGVMNGMMGGAQISLNGMGGGGMMMGNMQSTAGTSGLASAMTTFTDNSAVNKSGLTTTDMHTLILKLANSNGTI